MRIGIMTASHTDNNGTDIQAYALQELLLSIMCENDVLEIIDYRCKGLEKSNLLNSFVSIGDFLHFPQKLVNHYLHNKFRKRFFKISKKTYVSKNINNSIYDIIIVGSDQLWNPEITNGDMNFFLGFQTTAFKYSYAVSFGHSDIKRLDDRYGILEYLNSLDTVSVRELSSKKNLEDFHVICRHDLDPVLTLSEKSRARFEVVPLEKKPFILLYFVKLDYPAIEWAKHYAKSNNYEVILISDSIKKVSGIKCINCISLERWAGYVSSAMLMLTNSYHGLTYAISCKTDFYYVDLNTKLQENNRMLDLLEMMGLQERVWTKELSISSPPIMWNKVYKNISLYKEKSIGYLSRIVQGKEIKKCI